MNSVIAWLSTNPGKWLMTGVVLLVIGAVALVVEYIIEKRRDK